MCKLVYIYRLSWYAIIPRAHIQQLWIVHVRMENKKSFLCRQFIASSFTIQVMSVGSNGSRLLREVWRLKYLHWYDFTSKYDPI
jgi:hypothetical protein